MDSNNDNKIHLFYIVHFKVHRLQLKDTLQVKKQNNKDNTLKNK